jgi:hypothetical protein
MGQPEIQEPSDRRSDPQELFVEYLDYYRQVVEHKVRGLTDVELRTSRLPSGWTPIELVKHLVFMERRWLRWGFRAEPVETPWGDHGSDGRWEVGPDESLDDLLGMLHEGGRHTRRIVTDSDLAMSGAEGGRFAVGQPAPSLAWILFHVLQEYARHAGHLDIVRELADGQVGDRPVR